MALLQDIDENGCIVEEQTPENMILSYEQQRWLTQRGGRKERDVKIDEFGLYVEMYSPTHENKAERVYLPETASYNVI